MFKAYSFDYHSKLNYLIMKNKQKLFNRLKLAKIFLFVFLVYLIIPSFVFAQNDNVEISVFYSPTCPHCNAERAFFDKLEPQYPELIVNRFDITNQENISKLKEFYAKYNVAKTEYGMVPITFIKNEYFVGFNNIIEKNLESKIGKFVTECRKEIVKENCDQNQSLEGVSKRNEISIPIIGKINIVGFHPFIISSVFGFLDGFNACAMMALAFLLAVLVGTGNRKRIIIIGGTFVLTSGIVYFMFISAWLNLFMFINYIKIATTIISLLVIFFGAILLKDYFVKIVCKICDVPEGKKEGIITKFQRKIFSLMSKVGKNSVSLLVAIPIVAMLAAGVNTIELFCSLGLPMAYIKILTSYNLSTASYYFYILIYILFYILDQLIILFIAIFSLKITTISEKYLRAIKLISGIVLLILGIIMLIKPEILTTIS